MPVSAYASRFFASPLPLLASLCHGCSNPDISFAVLVHSALRHCHAFLIYSKPLLASSHRHCVSGNRVATPRLSLCSGQLFHISAMQIHCISDRFTAPLFPNTSLRYRSEQCLCQSLLVQTETNHVRAYHRPLRRPAIPRFTVATHLVPAKPIPCASAVCNACANLI